MSGKMLNIFMVLRGQVAPLPIYNKPLLGAFGLIGPNANPNDHHFECHCTDL